METSIETGDTIAFFRSITPSDNTIGNSATALVCANSYDVAGRTSAAGDAQIGPCHETDPRPRDAPASFARCSF
jgi:hypothetical protein